jgi:hypothetical protein
MYSIDMASCSAKTTSEQVQEQSESEESLSLSCGSSPFDDGDSETNDEALGAQAIRSRPINPYQFEPYASGPESNDSSFDENENEDRLSNDSW